MIDCCIQGQKMKDAWKRLKSMMEQVDFRSGRSCSDNIFTLAQLVQKRIAYDLEIHLTFVDLWKAYDSVPLKKLWVALEIDKINRGLIKAIRGLYIGANSRVRFGRKFVKPFPIKEVYMSFNSSVSGLCIDDWIIPQSSAFTKKG